MKNEIKFVFAILILCCSCSPSPEANVVYSAFPKEVKLEAQTVVVDTAIFRYPFRVRVDQDKAVVMDMHGANHYFHLFQYPGFRYLNSFGKRGDAPEEMLSADDYRFTSNALWTLDANKSELTKLAYSRSGDSVFREGTVKLDEGLLRVLDFVVYDDSTFIVPDYSAENRFCWVDGKGKLLRKSGAIPIQNEELLKESGPAVAQAWRSFIDYNPRNGVFAMVTQFGEVLEIYNLKKNTHVVCTGPNGEPEFKLSGEYAIPTGIMGFSDVQVTDKAIYAVFHGRTFKELMQQKEQIIDGGQYIYVFNLKGEPVCKYVLDRFIYGIYVDETNKTITATDVNSDQPIAIFHMN